MIDKMNMKNGKEIEDLQKDAVTPILTVTFLASPEAAVARAQLLNRGEESENQGIPTEDFSKSFSIDIPLAEKPSSNNLKNKVPGIEDIVRSYSTPESPVTTTQTEANSRWRKLKICASLCANLEQEMKAKPLKSNPETQRHLLDTPSGGSPKDQARSRPPHPPRRQSLRNTIDLNLSEEDPENEATVKPLKTSSDMQKHLLGTRSDVLSKDHARYNSPRPPGQPGFRRAVKINVTKSKEDVKQQDQTLDHNGNIEDKKRGKLEVQTVVQYVKQEKEEQCSAVDDPNNEILDIEDEGSASENGSDDLIELSKTLSSKFSQFSRSERFGRRRLSLPTSLPSSGNPTGRLLPTPPSARSQVSNVSPPISPRPVWSNAGLTTYSRISRSDPHLNISPNQETNLSLRSNLEVNRTIISELIQQRSSVISKINLMHDGTKTPKKMESTWDLGSPRGMVPMMGRRLLGRRAASLECASSIQTFNETRRNLSISKPRKSASVDSLPLRGRNTFPVTNAEVIKYFSMHSGKTATTASTAESGYSSGTGSNKNIESKMMLPSGVPFKGRRGSMPCIRYPKYEALERRRTRSEAEIVEDIEDEIRQRVSKRKQQLVDRAGGVAHHTRLQDRARARSTGGRLKQALFEMNSKRTTAELLQIASERKSSSTIR